MGGVEKGPHARGADCIALVVALVGLVSGLDKRYDFWYSDLAT